MLLVQSLLQNGPPESSLPQPPPPPLAAPLPNNAESPQQRIIKRRKRKPPPPVPRAEGVALFDLPPGYTPAMIRSTRERLFHLREPVVLSPQEYFIYWPFISNVWVQRGKNISKHGPVSEHFECRFTKGKKYVPGCDKTEPGQPKTRKKPLQPVMCGMKMRVVTDRTAGTITVERTVNRSSYRPDDIDINEHGHSLEYCDESKRNDYIHDMIVRAAVKGYKPPIIRRVIHDPAVRDIRDAIGAQHVNNHDTDHHHKKAKMILAESSDNVRVADAPEDANTGTPGAPYHPRERVILPPTLFEAVRAVPPPPPLPDIQMEMDGDGGDQQMSDLPQQQQQQQQMNDPQQPPMGDQPMSAGEATSSTSTSTSNDNINDDNNINIHMNTAEWNGIDTPDLDTHFASPVSTPAPPASQPISHQPPPPPLPSLPSAASPPMPEHQQQQQHHQHPPSEDDDSEREWADEERQLEEQLLEVQEQLQRARLKKVAQKRRREIRLQRWQAERGFRG